MIRGATPALAMPSTRARGVRPCFFTASAEARISAAAPSSSSIDQLRTVAQARDVTLADTHDKGGDKMLVSTGLLADYRCTYGYVQEGEDGSISLDAASAALLQLDVGQAFTMAGRA